MPFQRPTLPYDNVNLPNSDRYRELHNRNAPPSAEMLDADSNYSIDALNVLEGQIAEIEAGILVGSNDPANANLVPTTDGNGNISWIKVGAAQYQNSSITNVALGAGAVLTNNIGPGAITAPLIAPQAVTNDKIVSITGDKVSINTLPGDRLFDQTIPGSKIAPLAITRGNIALQAITNKQIAGAFFVCSVNAGVITTLYNQNVASFVRVSPGVFQATLSNTGAYIITTPLSVSSSIYHNRIVYTSISTYSIFCNDIAGNPQDPAPFLFFNILYLSL